MSNTTPMSETEYDTKIEKTVPFYSKFCEQTMELVQTYMEQRAAGCEKVNQEYAWLDTGCGTGTLVNLAAKRFPDFTFTLCDPSAEMLEQAVENCYRALKPGGIFLSFENFAPDGEAAKNLTLKHWGEYQMEQGKTKEQTDEHLSRYNKDYFPITLSEHKKLMKKCGFQTVELFWLSYMQMGIYGVK